MEPTSAVAIANVVILCLLKLLKCVGTGIILALKKALLPGENP
jgi:hypothetical protein